MRGGHLHITGEQKILFGGRHRGWQQANSDSYESMKLHKKIQGVDDSMPRVKVRYFALLRELLGNTREEEYEIKDGTMLMDLLLKHIPKRHRNASTRWKERIFETEKGKIKFGEGRIPSLRGYHLILINGRSYRSISEDGRHPGLTYKLKDGDQIAILPPVGGG